MENTNHQCIICGMYYYNPNKYSKFCSNVCRNSYSHKIPYDCDYCGKEIFLYPYEMRKLQQNPSIHKYCSKDCANKSKVKNNDNSKIEIKECKKCGKIFYTYHHNQKFCSKLCSSSFHSTKVICICDNCGGEFKRMESDVISKTLHFCSSKCKEEYQSFSKNDIAIITKYYHKIKTSELCKLLSKSYTTKSVNAKAIRLGLSKNRKWNKSEEQIVIELYDKKPIEEIMKLLPNRTEISIRRKAQALNVKSQYYTNRIYTKEDDKYLHDNYLMQSNQELATHLNRGEYAIEQRLRFLGLYRPQTIIKTGYNDLNNYMRAKLTTWKDKYRELNNYICVLTGVRSNIVVHHCRGFNLLMNETIDKLNFDIKDAFIDYTDDELDLFVKTFFEVQEKYKQYVCISEKIHILFHNTYGYGNNTMEQWEEFVSNFKNGYYEREMN